MMKFFISVFVCLFLISGVSQAAGCYTAQEFEAEQGIRIHSELMVIGLSCAHRPTANGKNLYVEHTKFTAKYADLFATYENIMMNYMRKNGIANPEKAMHTMRTDFANKISKDAAEMRPDIFCKTYAPRIEKVSQLDLKSLRHWAATPFPGYPVSKPICASAQK